MKRNTLLIMCAMYAIASLAGCDRRRQTSSDFGNHIGDRSLMLVSDAAEQIVVLYPPAKTRLVVAFEPREDDLFGMGLIGKLREAGYAVAESAAESTAGKPAGLALSYVVDEFEDDVRVIVHLGNDRLSRLYIYDAINNTFTPIGGWAWRCGEGE